MSVAGYCDAPRVPVRFTPLGSPWTDPKVLFSVWHSPVVGCGEDGWGGGGSTRGGGEVGSTGRVLYRVLTQHGYIGIARAQLMPQARVSAPARHSRPLLGPPHT